MKPTLRTIISVALFTMLTIASLNFFRAFDSEAAQVSPIPREAISRYTGIISKVHPSVRSWINEEAARIKSKGDVTSIYSSINSRFGAQLKAMNAGSGDIEAVAFVVLMQATKDMDDDLKRLMEEIKAINEAKQKMRDLVKMVDKDVKENLRKKDSDPCVPPKCGGYQNAIREAATALSRTPSRATIDVRAPSNIGQLKSLLDDLKGKLDGMNEMSEMTSLRLQMTMDRRSKFIETLSQMMKKISTTQDISVQNLK